MNYGSQPPHSGIWRGIQAQFISGRKHTKHLPFKQPQACSHLKKNGFLKTLFSLLFPPGCLTRGSSNYGHMWSAKDIYSACQMFSHSYLSCLAGDSFLARSVHVWDVYCTLQLLSSVSWLLLSV